MQVRVLFFGALKDIVGRTEDIVEVSAGATLEDIFDHYAQENATLAASRSSLVFACNQEFSKPDMIVNENDEVAFLPPVSGGLVSGGLLKNVR